VFGSGEGLWAVAVHPTSVTIRKRTERSHTMLMITYGFRSNFVTIVGE
jgi:hypothetical protein